MIPRTLSASSLLVAEGCMARFVAENVQRAGGISNVPAMTGTSVHYALEHFIKEVYLDKTASWSDKELLFKRYEEGYMITFGTSNLDTEAFLDGKAMVAKWYLRTNIAEGQVYSVEIKSNFPVKTSAGDIPVTYIWDRVDVHPDGTVEVVDYKTIRWGLNYDDLKRKIQPRLYAVAAMVQFPDAKRVLVTFDQLRHEAIGVYFSREECVATYRYIQRAAERIIATDVENPEETLNSECRFCVRKASCSTLTNSVAGGSIFAVSADHAATQLAKVSSQISALKQLEEDLQRFLTTEAEERDELEWTDADGNEIKFTARGYRRVDARSAAVIVGPEIMAQHGSLTVKIVDELLASNDLTPEQKAALKRCLVKTYGDPTPKIKLPSPI